MAEFIQRLDTSKLVQAETVLSTITSAFVAPSYNLPIFLFGLYAQEASEAVESLKMFTYLVSGSVLLDLIYLYRHEQHWLIKLFTILIMVLKFPTALAFATALQQRGGQFAGLGGLRGGDIAGATVWSMPGGFTSNGREGYQTVDEPDIQTPKPLGTAQPAPANQQPASSAYQNV